MRALSAHASIANGVFLGNSRSSLFGVDFNRSWNHAGEYPLELHPVKRFILDLVASGRNVDFVFDFYGSEFLFFGANQIGDAL